MICLRCRADAVAGTIADMPLCWTCIRQVKAKHGVSFVGAGPIEDASFFCDMPGPYSMGKKLAEEGKASASDATGPVVSNVGKAADAAKEIATTVKVLAITGACFGGAFLIYTMWRAHKAQEHAVQFATQHPEVLHAALLA